MIPVGFMDPDLLSKPAGLQRAGSRRHHESEMAVLYLRAPKTTGIRFVFKTTEDPVLCQSFMVLSRE